MCKYMGRKMNKALILSLEIMNKIIPTAIRFNFTFLIFQLIDLVLNPFLLVLQLLIVASHLFLVCFGQGTAFGYWSLSDGKLEK